MQHARVQPELVSALQTISYGIIAALALFLFFRAGSLPTSRWEPMSAGAFPRIIFLSIFILCLLAIAVDLFKQGWPKLSLSHAMHRLRRLKLVLLNLALFIAYVVVMPWLGYIVSTFTYLLLAQATMIPKRLIHMIVAVAVALTFSAGPYYLFADVFNIYLPRARLAG
jgi:hypothetical protein